MKLPVTIAFAISLIGTGCAAEKKGTQADEFNPRQVVSPIRAITNAKISKPEVLENLVGAGDLVLGVEINGEARAYPINMLTGPKREIINDKLGGRAIAATW